MIARTLLDGWGKRAFPTLGLRQGGGVRRDLAREGLGEGARGGHGELAGKERGH